MYPLKLFIRFFTMKTLLVGLASLLCVVLAYGQQCNGSFGDPVFEETFGNNASSGSNFGSALPAGTTNYTYSNSSGTQDGYYAITTNPNYALSPFFSTSDHTNDTQGSGYMLVVNADENTTGEFYRRTVTNLCGSLVYQFSAYFMNVLPIGVCTSPIPNNIKFVVEDENGNELGSISTGSIPSTSSPQWINYSFEFSMPDGSDNVSVVLINNSLGGCGNDLAIDDITFRACGSLATVSTDFTDFENGVCTNDNITFTASIDTGTYSNPAYQWQISTNNGTTWTNISGATSSSVTITGFSDGELIRYLVFEAENVNSPNCQVASETITVNLYDTPANTPANLQACDENQNGAALFNLEEVITAVLGGANAADYTITFHTSQTAANTGSSPIANPSSYQNTSAGQLIYVRVVNNEKGCFNTTSFQLIVNALPAVTTPVTLQQCDDDTDGISAFNLQEAIPLISSYGNFTYTFYKTLDGAWNETNTQRINNPIAFSNTNLNTVYANVKNSLGCYTVAEINLQVSTSQIPSSYQATLEVCDSDADGSNTNGIEYFNLSSVTTDLLSLFANNTNLSVSYYLTEADALAETNAINPSGYLNTTSPNSQWLYVRIDDGTNNSCFGLKRCVKLTVKKLPKFDINAPSQICLNKAAVTASIKNASTTYTYQWYAPDGTLISEQTTASITVGGTYTVVAYTTGNNPCSITKTFTVTESDVAVIDHIVVHDATYNNTITVFATGAGSYQYSLDGINYQESPLFENLDGGEYTMYVKDMNGCGTVTENVCVVTFPKYFTPNGDGVNDVWKVINITGDCVDDAVLTIFDRYGKLIQQTDITHSGWDGTYKGIMMPSTDYWYNVTLPNENNRVVRGHFSLIR